MVEHGPGEDEGKAGGTRPDPSWTIALLVPTLLFFPGVALILANHGPDPLLLTVHLLLCAVLVARCSHPSTVFLLILVVSLVPPVLWGAHVVGELGLFVALYQTMVRRPLARGLGCFVLVLVWIGVTALQPVSLPPFQAEAGLTEEAALFVTVLFRLLTTSGMVVLALVSGVLALVVRDRRAALAAARAETERMRVEQDQRARLARQTERTRIARELHDVVGHSLGVMISLSDGAARLVHTQPERAAEAMGRAAETGRSALAEVRDVLGLLRGDEAHQPHAPDVVELVDRVRAGGTEVELRCARDLERLPDHVRLCVYRVVQESLTNVGRHAGAGARARVEIGGPGDRVLIRIDDDGAGRPAEAGSGLTGLGERVRVQGGDLQAGPSSDGGWGVRAEIPVRRSVVETEDA